MRDELLNRLLACICAEEKDVSDLKMKFVMILNDYLCRYRQELPVQEELEEMCESCPVSACRKKLLDLTE